ncbi:MAG: ATP-binding protein, partial [Thermomicrobiales bacterium]
MNMSNTVTSNAPRQIVALAVADAKAAHLPPPPWPLTALIGREEESRAVGALLRSPDVRLVTIVGPGGVGKTRLAIDLAAAFAGEKRFADGVGFVSLAQIRDPKLVPAAIVQAFGLRDDAGHSSAETLARILAPIRLLLVLDSFERVAEAAPALVDLLGACPGLTLLVTSRSPLRIRGESVHPLEPFAEPVTGGGPALALFIARARQASPAFAPTTESLPLIAAICARLDGLPLTIELAASQIRVLGLETLGNRLEQRLPLLAGGPRDLPERQRTLRSTIAWSYDLLSPAERRLLRIIAVFAGGATLERIEAVGGDLDGSGEPKPGWVIEGVAALVDHSLIRPACGGHGERRYLMLETIREFSLDLLRDLGEEREVRERHATHFLRLAEETAPLLVGPDQRACFDLIDAERNNLRSAEQWFLDSGRADPAIRLATALWRFWWSRGAYSEGRSSLERALSIPVGDTAPALPCANGLYALSGLAWVQSDLKAAGPAAATALGMFKAEGSREGEARALNVLGLIATAKGDYAHAGELLTENLRICRELGDSRTTGIALMNLADVARCLGRPAESRALLNQGRQAIGESGDQGHIALILGQLGDIEMCSGDLSAAAVLYDQAIATFGRLGSDGDVGRTKMLVKIGQLALLRHDAATARAALGEGVGPAHGHANVCCVAISPAHMGNVADPR